MKPLLVPMISAAAAFFLCLPVIAESNSKKSPLAVGTSSKATLEKETPAPPKTTLSADEAIDTAQDLHPEEEQLKPEDIIPDPDEELGVME